MLIRALIATALIVASSAAARASTGAGPTDTYDVSILGLSIGDAKLSLNQAGESYELVLTGGFRFLFWTGEAEAVSEGVISGQELIPMTYRSRFRSPTRVFSTEIDFDQTGVTRSDWTTEPPLDPEEFGERVPITEEDLLGARDPLSAFMIPARSGSEACSRSVKAFSGVVRFDVELTVTPSDQNQAKQGEATNCAAAYRPISGQRIQSNEVDRLRDKGLALSVFEIAPGLWAPSKLGFETRFGTLMLTRITP
jgi:hypothetical protein